MNWAGMTPIERDSLIAAKVTGWESKECNPGPKDMVVGLLDEKSHGYACYKCGNHGRLDKNYYRHLELMPRYSTDISAAWQIAERFDEVIVSKHVPGNYHCELYRGTASCRAVAKTAQEAICLVALRLIGVDIHA